MDGGQRWDSDFVGRRNRIEASGETKVPSVFRDAVLRREDRYWRESRIGTAVVLGKVGEGLRAFVTKVDERLVGVMVAKQGGSILAGLINGLG